MTSKSEEPRSAIGPDFGHDDMLVDAVKNNWVDGLAPRWARPYLRLMRADRPIGYWLLFWPCAWSLALASIEREDLWLNGWFLKSLVLFFIGAVSMRGAGCVWNDITDRHIDASVSRTKFRPIPSGQVSVSNALIFMGALCLVGVVVLLQFNIFAILLGLSSLLIVTVYPFMKRVTMWPQAVLGLAFGWGALMGWAVRLETLSLTPVLMYIGTISWIIGCDTIYAHQDREDDALIGVKSTALRFADNTKLWISGFFVLTMLLLLGAVLSMGNGELFMPGGHMSATLGVMLAGLAVSAGLLVWQVVTLDINDPDNCLYRFRHAHVFGASVFVTFVVIWWFEKSSVSAILKSYLG